MTTVMICMLQSKNCVNNRPVSATKPKKNITLGRLKPLTSAGALAHNGDLGAERPQQGPGAEPWSGAKLISFCG